MKNHCNLVATCISPEAIMLSYDALIRAFGQAINEGWKIHTLINRYFHILNLLHCNLHVNTLSKFILLKNQVICLLVGMWRKKNTLIFTIVLRLLTRQLYNYIFLNIMFHSYNTCVSLLSNSGSLVYNTVFHLKRFFHNMKILRLLLYDKTLFIVKPFVRSSIFIILPYINMKKDRKWRLWIIIDNIVSYLVNWNDHYKSFLNISVPSRR